MSDILRLPARQLDKKTVLRLAVIVLLAAALYGLMVGLRGGSYGPAPSMTGKVISVTPPTQQELAQNKQDIAKNGASILLGTVLIQRDDGYQLLLKVYHSQGSGCLGVSTLHLSDIKVGETVRVVYWPDSPDTASNPHKGHAVYVGNRC